MTLIIIGACIVLIVTVGAIFINTSPQFGGKHTVEDKKRYEASGHYENGKFMNQITTIMDMSAGNMWKMAKAFIKGNPNKSPKQAPPMQKVNQLQLDTAKQDQLIWFGHSAFLLQMDGKNILLDPMFGDTPSPHPMLGTKRYAKSLPIEIEKLPEVDAILLSHDHYDHLDYESIQKLKAKTKRFLVPLGVGAHLRSWGIEAERVEEYNWWDQASLDSIGLVFTPSRHFSGRGLSDNSSTLWGSWVIQGATSNIYFSGDSGYGPHFKEIGEKYGPFDFAMLECGQYNEMWSEIHMMPEETVQAAIDVNTKVMMPIHWSAFTLALHDWNEPANRALKKANELNVPITIPVIGDIIELDNLELASEQWWLGNAVAQ